MPKKASDTSHLDNFTAEELEDILVQLCDKEDVKVSADGNKDALKTVGTNMLDNVGLGGIGKSLFGGDDDKKKSPATSPTEPAAPSKPPAPSRPASDIIRELPPDAKQGLTGIIQSAITAAMESGILGGGGKAGGSNPLFACFGNLLGGGSKASKSNTTMSANDGEASATQVAPTMSMEDIKTPDALFKFITSNPTVKTFVISGVQNFLSKFMQGGAAH